MISQALLESDSDSSDSSDSEVVNFVPTANINKPSVADLLRNSLPQQNMTSFESMAAQLATIASLNGFPPIYPGEYIWDFARQ